MSSKLTWMGAAVTAVMVAGAGCGSSPNGPSPISSGPPQSHNLAPVIASMAVTQSSYRTGRITASANDPDGQVKSGTVDWGDGSSSTITSGFSSITLTHRYNLAQAFQVTLSVSDDAGQMVQQSKSVSITVPPEACVGIEIIEVCAQATRDFKHASLKAKAGDIVLSQITLDDGAAGLTVPLAGGFGQLSLSANLVSGRITIGGKLCTVPFIVCSSIGTTTIQL